MSARSRWARPLGDRDRRGRQWAGPGTNREGRVLRCRQRRDHRGGPRRAGHLRGIPGHRERHGIGGLHRLRRHHLHGRRGVPVLAVPLGRVVRPVPTVQARARARSPGTSNASKPGSATDHDLAEIVQVARPRDRRQPLLPRHEEQVMVSSILRAFPEEFADHIELGRCPRPRRLPMPKLLDLATATPPTTSRTGASDPIGPTVRVKRPERVGPSTGSDDHAATPGACVGRSDTTLDLPLSDRRAPTGRCGGTDRSRRTAPQRGAPAPRPTRRRGPGRGIDGRAAGSGSSPVRLRGRTERRQPMGCRRPLRTTDGADERDHPQR